MCDINHGSEHPQNQLGQPQRAAQYPSRNAESSALACTPSLTQHTPPSLTAKSTERSRPAPKPLQPTAWHLGETADEGSFEAKSPDFALERLRQGHMLHVAGPAGAGSAKLVSRVFLEPWQEPDGTTQDSRPCAQGSNGIYFTTQQMILPRLRGMALVHEDRSPYLAVQQCFFEVSR